jgi:hypothetical protein
MRKLVLAAALTLAAWPAVAGESGFNPGTVVGNVYESPACAGVCGFGYSPPIYGRAALAPAYRHRHKRANAVRD